MENDLTYVNYMVNTHRESMDECWMELETANTWEHIKEISVRLNGASREYHKWRRIRSDLTNT